MALTKFKKIVLQTIDNKSFKIRHISLEWTDIFSDYDEFYKDIYNIIFNINNLGFYLTDEVDEMKIFTDDMDLAEDIRCIFKGLFNNPDKYSDEFEKKCVLISLIKNSETIEEIKDIFDSYNYPYDIKCFEGKSIEFQKVREHFLRVLNADAGYGFFGEILFYSVLRYLFDKKLLISKLFFVTQSGTYPHGSDGIFYDEKTKTIIMGEAKFTKNLKSGLAQALASLEDFGKRLESDFNIVVKSKNTLKGTYELREYFKNIHKKDLKNFNIEICVFVLHGEEYLIDDIKKIIDAYNYKFNQKNSYTINFISFPILSKDELIRVISRGVQND